MFSGHFAIALLIKALYPKIPTTSIIWGAEWIDVINGIFGMAGINRITPNPQATPYMFVDLDFMDYDHSLAATVFWSIIWSLLFISHGRKTMLVAGLSSMAHWLADWPFHNSDLALYPHSSIRFGMGLWGKLGTTAWIIEAVFCLVLCIIVWRLNEKRGVSYRWAFIFQMALVFQLTPWTSPLHYVFQLPRPFADRLAAAMVFVGSVIPSIIMTRLVDTAEEKKDKKN
ncbi:hypothetical protein PROFUN_09188 [Planoprotostelium fungivorum]|uniref:Transmembrane protein n=1 Tax=Planoprotostelium fungivorum TaxID=1890364 RepID=A0A2P6NHI0_9EUKA|nr:hypothetical protein PROFUN_09188 [Planoprotostelium fungivorum]